MARPFRDSRLHISVPLMLVLWSLFDQQSAWANGGTALFTASMFHLLYGNALLGIIEAWVVGMLFRLPFRGSVGTLIAANYFSAFFGVELVQHLSLSDSFTTFLLKRDVFFWLPRLMCVLVVLAFLITVVLEWPFFYWVLRRQEKTVGRSLLASVVAQSLSYSLLTPLYYSASQFGFLRDFAVERSLSFAERKDCAIYYVSPLDGNVHRRQLDGSAHLVVGRTHMPKGELFLRRSDSGQDWDLWMRKHGELQTDIEVCKSVAANNKTVGELQTEAWAGKSEWTGAADRLPINDLRGETEPDWRAGVTLWPDSALVAENAKTGATLRVALETPFLTWRVSGASLLPGDQVVMEFGDQVVLLDLNQRKIGLIAVGRSPVAVLPKDESTPSVGDAAKAVATPSNAPKTDSGRPLLTRPNHQGAETTKGDK
ncbi:MAG: hypothetical protein HY318_04885 [Armatimonadetes bacterium]|nr:hypothetical protein [Armatimonadota bacterium]